MNKGNTKDIKIGLVVMASGLSKRFGSNKLMAILDGKPLIKWILDSTENVFDKRVVITRNSDVKSLCDALYIDCIMHDFPGRNDTVRLGLSSLIDEVDYCFFTPGDQPLITKKSILKLIDNAKREPDKILRAGFASICGSPVGFPKKLFNELLSLPEGKGGNIVVKNNPELVQIINVDNEYELWDVDTVSDLENIRNRFLLFP